MNDDLNPAYTFNQTATPTMASLVRDPAQLMELASLELANRGVDIDGKWVGFKTALEQHNDRMTNWSKQWPSASN